jgi:hypothetical protein
LSYGLSDTAQVADGQPLVTCLNYYLAIAVGGRGGNSPPWARETPSIAKDRTQASDVLAGVPEASALVSSAIQVVRIGWEKQHWEQLATPSTHGPRAAIHPFGNCISSSSSDGVGEKRDGVTLLKKDYRTAGSITQTRVAYLGKPGVKTTRSGSTT